MVMATRNRKPECLTLFLLLFLSLMILQTNLLFSLKATLYTSEFSFLINQWNWLADFLSTTIHNSQKSMIFYLS